MLPTGSGLELAERCIASAVFEGVDTVTEYGDQGHAQHAFLERVALTGDREASLAAVPEKYRESCADYDLDQLPAGQHGKWAVEVAQAFDYVSGRSREIGRSIGRNYAGAGLKDTENAGTIDVLGLGADAETVIAIDYKGGHKAVTRAKENLQLGLAAVCAAEIHDRPRALVSIAYTADGENPRFDTAELDAVDLAAMRERIAEIDRRVVAARVAYYGIDPVTGETGIRPRMTVGAHCGRCPALMTCPAQGALVRRLVATPEDVEADFKKGIADNAVADLVYRRLKAVKEVIERALAVLYARAARSPIALSTGLVLGEVETMRDSLDGKIVADVVRELYGPQWVEKAVAMDTSKAALERLGRELKAIGGGSITERVTKILDEAAARGGVISKPTRTVKEHRSRLPKETE